VQWDFKLLATLAQRLEWLAKGVAGLAKGVERAAKGLAGAAKPLAGVLKNQLGCWHPCRAALPRCGSELQPPYKTRTVEAALHRFYFGQVIFCRISRKRLLR